MRKTRIRRTALALMSSAALGAATMTAVAATSHVTAPTKRSTRTVIAPPGVKLTFSAKRLKVRAGRLTLRVKNRDDIPHNIALRGKKLKPRKGRVVGTGKVSKIVVKLKPGKYTFYCSVFGHEAGGMKGILRVTR